MQRISIGHSRDVLIGAFEAHQRMSTQALNFAEVREGRIDTLLNPTSLYDDWRHQGHQDQS